MPKHLTIDIPHDLGAAELRHCLDLHTNWAMRRMGKESIAVEAEDWAGDVRGFSANRFGLNAAECVRVSDDRLHLEASVPWTIGLLAPAIEAVARHHAARLPSVQGAA